MNLFRIVLSTIFWLLLAQGALAQQQSAATQRLLERNKMFEPAIVQVAENVYTAIGYQVSANTMIVGSAQDLGRIFEDIRLAMVDSAKAPAGVGDLLAGEEELQDTRCQGIQAETAARKVLAVDLNTEPRAMILESTEQVDWPDASLGCPQPDQTYAQVVTPGFRMAFSFEGETYAVHTNTDGSQVVHCELP